MIIRKLRLCSVNIETLVNCQDRYIVGDLENGGQAGADYVGRMFEVR